MIGPVHVSSSPSDLRQELFERIDGIVAVLAEDVATGDELRRLPDTTLVAMRNAGLLKLKVPSELGGFEAEPALQFEVFERVATTNACAAWCLFIHADTVAALCARLADAGLAQVMVDGDVPVVCGGGGLRPGKLRAVDGGYRLSGKFRYGSGMHGASWVMLTGYLAGANGSAGEVRVCAVRRADVNVADTWHVLGMRGTGSNDFSIDDAFVPEELTYRAASAPLRGGRMFRTGVVGYLGYTVPPVALGIARRVLDELVALAPTRMRGYTRPQVLASRSTFQSFLGEADVRLKAARALMLANGFELMEHVEQGGTNLRAVEAEVRAAGALTVRTASDVVADVIRFAGGDALWQGGVFERAARDLTVVASHLLANESAYENHAQFLLGLPDADPMA